MALEITTYEDAVAWLMSRVNYEKDASQRQQLRHVKLERTRELLSRIGDPQESIPAVHIAGTKGKGSTAAMTAAILSAAGLRTGLYTSPHLESFTERIRVQERDVDEATFAKATREILPEVIRLDEEGQFGCPTFFEILTAIGWWVFRECKMDVVVLEVGLGGRLDATSVCNPIATCITNISLDHTELLGNTTREIAAEKAGIIRKGVPLVTATEGNAFDEVTRHATLNQAPVFEVREGEAFQIARTENNDLKDWCCTAWLKSHLRDWGEFHLPLAGFHQAVNAAMAIELAEQVRERLSLFTSKSFDIGPEQAREGWARLYWPARFEVVHSQPVVIFDAAHNPASIASLTKSLAKKSQASRRIALFSAASDKDATGMLELLSQAVDEIVLTEFQSNPRAIPVSELRDQFHSTSCEVRVIADPVVAFEETLARVAENDIMCVTGSIYLVAELRAEWFHEQKPVINGEIPTLAGSTAQARR
ncbi:bifunctional folylpolyglutamate synthase/dihydrofolate synthase [Calycomorphotria hydatis]|uniref:Dihydrofolate synthase/folylpolyglutamate synthase n=1 Tax=Calycomorphotria hydatis TaxID=2528027 RepID=A0A517T7X1_9PLAN|nr:folylpolyglutamate synthase/dihydrofolate synthase family protein [Calycomorphotria hydatis]QDT64467.1 Folylpolyglutamate synthase [Calycomorphotria hydatis]